MGLFGNKELREEKQARKEAKKQAAQEKLEKYGKVLQFIISDDAKCTMFLRENGIEFTTQNNDEESGIATWGEIQSITLEDGEELQSRVTATRLLMLGSPTNEEGLAARTQSFESLGKKSFRKLGQNRLKTIAQLSYISE